MAIRIALMGYEGVQTLDIAGPLDALGAVNCVRAGAYTTLTTSLDGSAFSSETGLRVTPDCAVARLGSIREYLSSTDARVERIATTVGFRSDDAFRRAFDRRFGLSPTEFRARFSLDGQSLDR